jgi:hypothetical protein
MSLGQSCEKINFKNRVSQMQTSPRRDLCEDVGTNIIWYVPTRVLFQKNQPLAMTFNTTICFEMDWSTQLTLPALSFEFDMQHFGV